MPSSRSWSAWLRAWDAQQEAFNADRERRFHAMFDVLEATVGRRFRALDLGSGPGSLSLRLLRRFPRATVVAIDYDPVVLRVGQGALGSYGGRLRWIDTKLAAPGWTTRLPRGRYDAALSTTALHWLRAADLRRLYRDLGRVIRPGGVFLNGDRLAWGPRDLPLARIASRARRIELRGRHSDEQWRSWRKWWRDAERDPVLGSLFAERARRHSQHPRVADVPIDVQVRALRMAGFRRVEVVWRDLEDAVLCAIR